MGLRRLLAILIIVCRYRIDLLLPQDKLPLRLRLLLRCGPWRLCPAPALSRGQRLRLALESLGPIFIKFGQLLSTRRDLLPDDIAEELALLQDRVPPFPSDQAVAVIEKALGQSVDDVFASFDRNALASASIAQVHCATLKTGEQVVVKVVRPGIETTIGKDIQLMQSIARIVRRHLPDGRRLRPEEVVEDYRHTIYDELDLQREGANTSQLRRNFAASDILYVPEVYWDYTRRNVLVIERIHGIPVTDVETLNAQGTDMKKLAERGVEIFFTQVFRDSFFHADMHPGNIFVAEGRPQSPQYIAIDCAIYWRSSSATTVKSQNSMLSAAGCLRTPKFTNLKPPSAASANRFLKNRCQKFPSASCWYTCFKLLAASIWKYNPRWCCCKRPC